MNRFKNYAMMAAGFTVLAAVIAGITAGPAIAAAVKAALIKNVDERGRSPHSVGVKCYASNSREVIAYLSPSCVGSGGGHDNYTANHSVIGYIEAGDSATVIAGAFTGTITANVTITGYLVDLTI